MNQRDQTLNSLDSDDDILLTEAVADPVAAAAPNAPQRRSVLLPCLLFVGTCCTTFFSAITFCFPTELASINQQDPAMLLREQVLANGANGLLYMVAVVGILLAHEMGHFLMTLRYRVPASLPFFIPVPIFFGTMGAVIAMDGRKANRKEIFDIGIAGPLAGLVIAVPVLIAGVATADFSVAGSGGIRFDIPLLIQYLLDWLQPQGYTGQDMIWLSQMNPLLLAGWFGLLITGLNMAPVSQLDGGHVIYTLFGKKGRWIARGFVFLAIAFVTLTGSYIWAVMLLLVIVVLGIDHPPTSDDTVPIGPFRTILGWVSLAIPVLCFPPQGLIGVM